MLAVIRAGDIATGHTDIEGNAVTGVVRESSCTATVRALGVAIATSASLVDFPSHPHALDGFGNPTDYHAHSASISATSAHMAEGHDIARSGDTVASADVAGGNAMLVASTSLVLA